MGQTILSLLQKLSLLSYRKIPRIRPPFDAKKLMPKRAGGLIHEDLTFGIKVKSQK